MSKANLVLSLSKIILTTVALFSLSVLFAVHITVETPESGVILVPHHCTPSINVTKDESVPGHVTLNCVVIHGVLEDVYVNPPPSGDPANYSFSSGHNDTSGNITLGSFQPGCPDLLVTFKWKPHAPQPLPVELSSFTAEVTSSAVDLQWVTQTETNLAGYNIYRNTEDSPSSATVMNANIIPGSNTSSTAVYHYMDDSVDNNMMYYYWLEAVDLDGSLNLHGPVNAYVQNGTDGNQTPLPGACTVLNSAYPNPFNPETCISFTLDKASDVKLEIMNVKGQVVHSMQKSYSGAGSYSYLWNGKSNSGMELPSGIYLVQLKAGDYIGITKVIYQK